MLINNSKTRDPIAVWFLLEEINPNSEKQLPPPQDITLGWDNFRKKLQQEDIPLAEIQDERWIERPPNERHCYNDFGREKLLVGKYMIIDGNHSLKNKLNTDKNVKANNLTRCFLNNLCVLGKNQVFDKDSCLFFNADPKYRENILNGKQPLRSTRYYRKNDNDSSDPMEGVTHKQRCHTDNIDQIYTELLPNEAYIFSLHDNPDGVKKFGRDLFKINNISEWMEEIYLQVDNYWLQKKDDYVGCVVYLGKVNYSNDKKIEDLGLLTKDETSNLCKGLGIDTNTKINETVTITNYPIAQNFFNALELGLLTKQKHYEKESEVRLIIIPLFSNKSNDGHLLNNHSEENLIEMKLKRDLVCLVNETS
ncbi:MAG: hypothetical protein DSY43_04860 [Gammaproteobacteria bacterium]|nr:MAG: hypothetical protein DSY43_04860 [Gammaproteobacteria bacterium]